MPILQGSCRHRDEKGSGMKSSSRVQHQGAFEVFGGLSMQAHQNCSNCLAESRVRHRDFSEQVWSLLLVWGEISESSVDQLLCDDCYRDLREVLIERGPEMEAALKGGPAALQPAVAVQRKSAATVTKEIVKEPVAKNAAPAAKEAKATKSAKAAPAPAKKGRSKIAS